MKEMKNKKPKSQKEKATREHLADYISGRKKSIVSKDLTDEQFLVLLRHERKNK